jgi:hypothetical protein
MAATSLGQRRPPLALGWEAARANIAPALLLQAAMLAIVVLYYVSPPCRALLDRVADYKRAHGIAFVVVATVLAASVLPELLLVALFQPGRVRPENLRNLLFTAPIWAIDGISVDLLYRGLAAWLGDTVTLGVIVAKICVDQFVYNVFFAAPYGVLAYHWKNSRFSFVALRRGLTLGFYRDKVVPTLCTTWAVWIPLTAMIYSLPLALQFPLFSLALTFWVLLLTYMTNHFAGKSGHPAVIPMAIAPEPAR